MEEESNSHDIPEYLNKEFFKKALENGLKVGGIKVERLKLTMGSKPGDNYCSLIYRAQIEYRQENGSLQNTSLIIKSIPYSDMRKAVFDLQMPFKEGNIYKNILSRMEYLLPDTKLAAKFYYMIEKPVFTLVFEDLRESGFTLASRQRGLNENECEAVLDRLGKYHAASIYLFHKEPKLFEHSSFQVGIFTPESLEDKLCKTFFIDSFEMLMNVVEEWPGCEKYVKKMRKLYPNYKDRILSVVEPAKDGVTVLIHGDLWVNNFMFKYNAKNPQQVEDFRLFDFQAFFLTSPGIDLNYFLSTSVQYDVLVERRDQLVEYYYHSLRSTLEYLKHKDIPSLDDIKEEVKRKVFYGFVSAAAVLPILSIDESDSKDCSLELLSDKDAAEKKRSLAYKSKRFIQMMKYTLQYSDQMGVLD